MTPQIIDRKALKADTQELLQTAQVSPKGMTALYLLILLILDLVRVFSGDSGILSTFISILVSLMGTVLGAGFLLYCMAIRRGERAEYLTLFDGFSFVGKLIALCIVQYLFIFLWSMLFLIPGIIAAYRYRFAFYNLYEDPGIGIMEAMSLSCRQTAGYKGQLLLLDLRYLGWGILASLPTIIETSLIFRSALSGSPALAAMTTAPLMPDWAWVLVSGLWMLAVTLFYLAHYRCTDLAYFDIAKSTSGADIRRRQTGPDNMGGY